jgi:hypothetical protein
MINTPLRQIVGILKAQERTGAVPRGLFRSGGRKTAIDPSNLQTDGRDKPEHADETDRHAPRRLGGR